MATPQPGYPQPGQDQEHYDANQHEVPDNASPAQGGPPAPAGAGRKKRHYAGQAYDFGAGANSALGGQQQGGGGYPGPPGGGYGQQPQQPGQPAPAYSGPASPTFTAGAPGYGQQPAAVGGYQPPELGYPSHGTPTQQPGMGQITQGMGNLAMGNQAQPQTPQMQARPQMNQLYPTDLLNQPLNVSELDLPPPPIILPPNVSKAETFVSQISSNRNRLASRHPQMPTALQNTFARPSMQSQQRIPCSRNLVYPSHWSSSLTALYMTMKTQYQSSLIR